MEEESMEEESMWSKGKVGGLRKMGRMGCRMREDVSVCSESMLLLLPQ